MPLDGWIGPDGDLGRYISEESRRSLNGYREQPTWVEEHANEEGDVARGGYQHRQLFELVQNGADALWTESEAHGGERKAGVAGGRIEVRLTAEYLYCADDGEPIDQKGVRALMSSHLSPKRGTNQIGTFGLGFKAVLDISAAPEFFSRSGSFRFDQTRSQKQIRTLVPTAKQCPVLRLAEPIDPTDCWKRDAVLRDLMAWAVNVVRLPLRQGARADLRQQMEKFPARFLLFVAHVASLTLIDDSGAVDRVLKLERVDDSYLLAEGDSTSEWRLFQRTHLLSDDARADRRPGDDRDEVPIWWAAPVDRLDRPGKFWAFFPTDTKSLVPGILNAPWKTNEDRQNLLPGRYNRELIGASATLIADALPRVRTVEDPGRHLDFLPRRHRQDDSDEAHLLRERLYSTLQERAIVPDQKGKLRRVGRISYPPVELTPSSGIVTAPFERWSAYAGKPGGWLHHKAVTTNRLAVINRLFDPDQSASLPPRLPRASLAEWLETLVQDTGRERVASSMAAIQTAARIPGSVRARRYLGRIVLTESDRWRKPDPLAVFLPLGVSSVVDAADPDSTVNSELAADRETVSALKKLGLKPRSREAHFRGMIATLRSGSSDAEILEGFWESSRALTPTDAEAIIREGRLDDLRVRTRSGLWKPLKDVLMPGAIVPGDGTRDDGVTVDCDFHEPDLELLGTLGVKDGPYVWGCGAQEQLQFWRWDQEFWKYQEQQNEKYRALRLRSSPRGSSPREGYLAFVRYKKIGPLRVLHNLSEEGAVAYTFALLSLDDCYEPWEMWHTGSNRRKYSKMPCESLPIWFLREHGRLQTPSGIVPLADALEQHPASPAALSALLQHPKAAKIKEAFDLSDPVPHIFGEGEPTPLTDIWPGLRKRLKAHHRDVRLVPCERICVAGTERPCTFRSPEFYLVGSVIDDERSALKHVVRALELKLGHREIEEILERRTPSEIEERRAAVRQYPTDADRLLEAVGEQTLRDGLPDSLVDILQEGHEPLAGSEIAEAAIATYHTGALKEFRRALDHLEPPVQWAGSQKAVAFVQSLGFSDEWAGVRGRRRPPFMEIEGPRSLPELHDYQQTVAANVREMLRSDRAEGVERRGMISLPTGSGKTRVAVQAVVEAIRDDGFRGGVLWVADRDELCEQAVKAWEDVWRSEGIESGKLRVSRLWSGQGPPLPISEKHLVVASIQTLNLRLKNRPADYEFLKDFKLVVFDEAHRSVAPTFTSVMAEIGLTHRRELDEPFLIGLTATPYRGHDVAETARLVGRYGRARLDSGAFADDDPQKVIQELQNRGVLAQADQEIIEGDTLRLTRAEWKEVRQFVRGPEQLKHLLAWLPQSAENRIANSTQRTRRILAAYKDHIGHNWPTLIFATSVEHAQTLAALLNREGVVARAVSGQTDAVTRRRVVEAFRGGEIKALVNYAVFGEGFDAPKTRAIIVARPVYSPNLYFQMIGRGLRGPEMTGGTDRCLILNVRDNIEGFGHNLAFSDLDWLWDR